MTDPATSPPTRADRAWRVAPWVAVLLLGVVTQTLARTRLFAATGTGPATRRSRGSRPSEGSTTAGLDVLHPPLHPLLIRAVSAAAGLPCDRAGVALAGLSTIGLGLLTFGLARAALGSTTGGLAAAALLASRGAVVLGQGPWREPLQTLVAYGLLAVALLGPPGKRSVVCGRAGRAGGAALGPARGARRAAGGGRPVAAPAGGARRGGGAPRGVAWVGRPPPGHDRGDSGLPGRDRRPRRGDGARRAGRLLQPEPLPAHRRPQRVLLAGRAHAAAPLRARRAVVGGRGAAPPGLPARARDLGRGRAPRRRGAGRACAPRPATRGPRRGRLDWGGGSRRWPRAGCSSGRRPAWASRRATATPGSRRCAGLVGAVTAALVARADPSERRAVPAALALSRPGARPRLGRGPPARRLVAAAALRRRRRGRAPRRPAAPGRGGGRRAGGARARPRVAPARPPGW